MNIKRYNVFVSHSWDCQSDLYVELIAVFERAHCCYFRNYSIPRGSPLNNRSGLFSKQVIKQQIRASDVVLVIAGTYRKKLRDWVAIELAIARDLHKPVIAVCPISRDNIPEEILAVATISVKWRAYDIVNEVRRLST